MPRDISTLIASMVLKGHEVAPFLREKLLEALSTSLDDGHMISMITTVNSVDYSNSGNMIVTASKGGTVRIWVRDVEGWRCEALLPAHSDNVASAAFNCTGDKVVTASWDNTAKIWIRTHGSWRCQATLPHHNKVWTAAFNSTGDRVVTAADDGKARVWWCDTDTWVCEATLTCCSEDLPIWAVREGSLKSAVFNSAGNKILATSWAQQVTVWVHDHGTWKREFTTKGNLSVFNQAGDMVATSSKDEVTIWTCDHVHGWHCEAVLAGHDIPVVSTVFDSTGTRVATAFQDGTVMIWKRSHNQWICEALLDTHIPMNRDHASVTFNACGDRLFVSSSDHMQGWICTGAKGWTHIEIPLHISGCRFLGFDKRLGKVIGTFHDGRVLIIDVERFFLIARFLKQRLRLEQALMVILIHHAHKKGERFDLRTCQSWEKHFDSLPDEIKRELEAHVLRVD